MAALTLIEETDRSRRLMQHGSVLAVTGGDIKAARDEDLFGEIRRRRLSIGDPDAAG